MGIFDKLKSKKENFETPVNPSRFHFQQGEKALQKGNLKKAREEVNKAIELDPEASDVQNLFEAIRCRMALEKVGRIDEIIGILKECIQVNPDTTVHGLLGRIYEFQKRIEEANQEYRIHLMKHPLWEYMPVRTDGGLLSGMRKAVEDELACRMLGLEIQIFPPHFSDWKDIRNSLKISNPGIELLIEALKNGDELARFTAATAFEEIGDKRVVEPLIEALKDDSSDVRRQVVCALGKIGDERALEPLTEALKDKDKKVRENAKYFIETIKNKLK
jgi:tetratricopeptide (TPR) repeat protein